MGQNEVTQIQLNAEGTSHLAIWSQIDLTSAQDPTENHCSRATHSPTLWRFPWQKIQPVEATGGFLLLFGEKLTTRSHQGHIQVTSRSHPGHIKVTSRSLHLELTRHHMCRQGTLHPWTPPHQRTSGPSREKQHAVLQHSHPPVVSSDLQPTVITTVSWMGGHTHQSHPARKPSWMDTDVSASSQWQSWTQVALILEVPHDVSKGTDRVLTLQTAQTFKTLEKKYDNLGCC